MTSDKVAICAAEAHMRFHRHGPRRLIDVGDRRNRGGPMRLCYRDAGLVSGQDPGSLPLQDPDAQRCFAELRAPDDGGPGRPPAPTASTTRS